MAVLLVGTVVSTSLAIRATNAERAEASERVKAEHEWRRAQQERENALAQERLAKERLVLATAEQQRAEGNLDLAMAALDAVYLDAIGRDKLLGEPIAKPNVEKNNESAQRMPLTDLERELLKRGLEFYDQFAQQNATAPRILVQTAQAYYRVALLQNGLGETDSAEQAYRAAIERFEKLTNDRPNDFVSIRGLAQARAALANVLRDWSDATTQYTESIKAYSKAIELQPDDADVWYQRASLHFILGDVVGGTSDLDKAMQLDPNNVQYLKIAVRDTRKNRSFRLNTRTRHATSWSVSAQLPEWIRLLTSL